MTLSNVDFMQILRLKAKKKKLKKDIKQTEKLRNNNRFWSCKCELLNLKKLRLKIKDQITILRKK